MHSRGNKAFGSSPVVVPDPLPVTFPQPVEVDGSVSLTDSFGRPIDLSTDAFQRLRVSEPSTLFDSKQVFYEPALYFTGTTALGGTSVYNNQRSSTLLSCTNTPGSRAVRQTKRFFNYQPGKSQLIKVTFVATNGPVANVQKSVGYFDDNNGIFFRMNGLTIELVRRSNTSGAPVDVAVPQASWNLDKLDGTGPSGYTAAWDKSQIFFLDFEWLGVGVARCGFVINGELVYCHAFYNANVLDVVYMRSPNLPVRWEILGNGASASLESICCSVVSEGGQQLVGLTRSVDRGVTSKVISNASGAEQIIAIRLQSAYNRAPVFPRSIDILTTGVNDTYWFLCLNPTVGGAAVWTPVASSAVEFDVNLPAVGTRIVASPGVVLASGYFSSAQRSENILSLAEALTIASDFAGTSDVLSLCARPISGANVNYLGSISWTEPT